MAVAKDALGYLSDKFQAALLALVNANEAAAALNTTFRTDVTATAAELNKLDGATVSTAEINILDGATVNAAELNQFDAGAADGASLAFVDVQLTAAQVNALMGTNIELVAAPGAGLAIYPVALQLFLAHGGTDFVQAAGGDHLAIRYSASNEIAELGSEAQCTALIEASADAALFVPITGAFVPEDNKAIDLDNNGTTEYTTGDGTLSVRVFYRVVLMAAFT